MTLIAKIGAGFAAVGADVKDIRAQIGTDDKPVVNYPDGRGTDIRSVLQWLADIAVPFGDDTAPAAHLLYSSLKTDELVRAALAAVRGIALYVPLAQRCVAALDRIAWTEADDKALLDAARAAVAALQPKLAGRVSEAQRDTLTAATVAWEGIAARTVHEDADRDTVREQTAALTALAAEIEGDDDLRGADSFYAIGQMVHALAARQTVTEGSNAALSVLVRERSAEVYNLLRGGDRYVDAVIGGSYVHLYPTVDMAALQAARGKKIVLSFDYEKSSDYNEGNGICGFYATVTYADGTVQRLSENTAVTRASALKGRIATVFTLEDKEIKALGSIVSSFAFGLHAIGGNESGRVGTVKVGRPALYIADKDIGYSAHPADIAQVLASAEQRLQEKIAKADLGGKAVVGMKIEAGVLKVQRAGSEEWTDIGAVNGTT